MENKKNHNDKEGKAVTLNEKEYLELKEKAGKAGENWDKLLRLQAEFENSRKRMERERQDFLKFANEGLVFSMLNILDDLERATELAETKHQDMPAFLKGVEMILAHFYELLKENGVKPIEAKGKIFDPHFHEALLQVEDKSVAENTVVEEMQKGYMLNERVLRTAKVKVSKNSEAKHA